MKIYNTNNKCEEEQTISDQSTTLINNIGLTYPGTAMPLRPLTINEHNSIRGINQIGLNVINPHYGYNASGCCGNDTLVVKGNLSVTGDFTFGEWGRFHDVSANWVQFYNHSSFFTWGVHIIPKSGTVFTLAMRGLHTNPHYHVHWDHQSRTALSGDHDLPASDLVPTTADPHWEGSLLQDTTGWTDNDFGDRDDNNPTNASPQTPDPNNTGLTNTGVVNTLGTVTGTGSSHSHSYSNYWGGQTTGTESSHTHNMNHDHDLSQHTHDHDHKLNQDKCNNTHDHYIMDETRLWYEGWLYPGFGGYGNSTQSMGTKYEKGPGGAVNITNFGTDGSGTDYDPSHNLKAYGAQNGIHDDGLGYQGQVQIPADALFPSAAAGTATDEYTGNILTERPRLGGWSDRSSFPSCSFKGDSSFEYGMAIATSIPFDGWLINDASGSPFRNKTIWPHSGHSHSHCHPCDQIEHHEHPGPSSRFSWMLGKYDVGDVAQVTDASSFILTIQFYLVRCDPEGCFGHEGVATPIKIGTATIKNRCGSAKWGDGGVMSATDGTVTIKAGDGIGMFIKSNNDGNGVAPTNSSGSLHSPATFTLEVHRKY